jgi:hypothetical protein
MRLAEQIQIAFVSLIAALAGICPLSRKRQLEVYSLTIVMILIVCAGRFSAYALGPTDSTTFRDWLPAALFLVPYGKLETSSRAQMRSSKKDLPDLMGGSSK